MAKRSRQKTTYYEGKVDRNILLRLYPSNGKGTSAAFGSLTIDDTFVIRVQVFETKKGFFVAFPSVKTKTGDYTNTAFCIGTDIIKRINETAHTLMDEMLEDE